MLKSVAVIIPVSFMLREEFTILNLIIRFVKCTLAHATLDGQYQRDLQVSRILASNALPLNHFAFLQKWSLKSWWSFKHAVLKLNVDLLPY